MSTSLPKQEFRGRCKYGTGLNCFNERTIKPNGKANRLCEKHSLLHNERQRESNRKRRSTKRPKMFPTSASIEIGSNTLLSLSINASSSEREYRGRCKYRNGFKCSNERTLKIDGTTHRMCDKHRDLHNEKQRKSDRKRRESKRSFEMVRKEAIQTRQSEQQETYYTPSFSMRAFEMPLKKADDRQEQFYHAAPSIALPSFASLLARPNSDFHVVYR